MEGPLIESGDGACFLCCRSARTNRRLTSTPNKLCNVGYGSKSGTLAPSFDLPDIAQVIVDSIDKVFLGNTKATRTTWMLASPAATYAIGRIYPPWLASG